MKYKHSAKLHNLESPRAVIPVITSLLKPKSIVDFGCGLGSWLRVFKDSGIDKILAYSKDIISGNYTNFMNNINGGGNGV